MESSTNAHPLFFQRLLKLSQTLQFLWYIGHVIVLCSALSYGLSNYILAFPIHSGWVRFGLSHSILVSPLSFERSRLALSYSILTFRSYLGWAGLGLSYFILAFPFHPSWAVLGLLYFVLAFHHYFGSAWLAYRMVFLGVLLSYSIVVYKGYVARKRKQEAVGLRVMLQNEDMQYLLMAVAFLFLPKIPLAVAPSAIYSTFHVLTYTRSHLVDTIFPAIDPGTKAASETLKSAIGKAVRNSYDTSMTVVSLVELGAWFHILISVLFSQKDSWILLCLYSVFLRARFEQGTFVAAAIRVLTRKLDSLFGSASMPAGVNGAWNSVKDIMRQAVEITDLNGYTTVAHSSGGHKGTD